MKKLFLTLFAVAFFVTIFAQNDYKPIVESELIVIKNRIKEKNTEINTLICPFIQTKKWRY